MQGYENFKLVDSYYTTKGAMDAELDADDGDWDDDDQASPPKHPHPALRGPCMPIVPCFCHPPSLTSNDMAVQRWNAHPLTPRQSLASCALCPTVCGVYPEYCVRQWRSPRCDGRVAGMQGLRPAARQRAGADLEGLDGEEEPPEPWRGEDERRAKEPWWPQDQLASDMALRLALMVEQLGASALPADWSQVRPKANHSCQLGPMPTSSLPCRLPARAPYGKILRVHGSVL